MKSKQMKTFNKQIRKAIDEHGQEHIDIIVLTETKKIDVYGVYHSKNHSFEVTDTFSLHDLGTIDDLMKYEDEFEELCVCIED